jgi:ERCC4-type nuclease
MVLIESSPMLPVKFGKWKEISVASIMNSITLDWKLTLIYSPSLRWTAFTLKSLCSFAESTKEAHKLQFDKKPREMDEAVMFLVESIPYIGPIHARALLSKFGSFKGIVDATVEELMTINGISDTRAKYIYELLRYEWREKPLKEQSPIQDQLDSQHAVDDLSRGSSGADCVS